MLLINHPPLGPKSPSYLKTLAALQAVSDSPSAFFTTGAPGDAEREELMLGTQLFNLPVARRAYLYLLRSFLGRRVPEVMTAEQLGKQQLLAAQLFAEARNAFAKAGQPQEELIAFFLAVRCALRSEVVLPQYLDEMTTQYAKAIGARAEAIGQERLSKYDLPNFLAMTTVAFSAYEDNFLPLSKADLKRYSGLSVRSLTQLHEYLKTNQASLPVIEVAMVMRSMVQIAGRHPADTYPTWLQEVVGRAPARAATIFLQQAAIHDKSLNVAMSANMWAHAAEILASTDQLEEWQQPFVDIAPNEAAKRLGELAVKARQARKDFNAYALFSSYCNRYMKLTTHTTVAWLDGFRQAELVNVQNGLRKLVADKANGVPNIECGIDGLLIADLSSLLSPGKSNSEKVQLNDAKTYLRLVAETTPGIGISISV